MTVVGRGGVDDWSRSDLTVTSRCDSIARSGERPVSDDSNGSLPWANFAAAASARTALATSCGSVASCESVCCTYSSSASAPKVGIADGPYSWRIVASCSESKSFYREAAGISRSVLSNCLNRGIARTSFTGSVWRSRVDLGAWMGAYNELARDVCRPGDCGLPSSP